MQVDALTTASTLASDGPNNYIGLADDFDSFLKLLTTQLTNQDPLEPLDATKFTEQLVQFSGVEQAIKSNDTLEQLTALMRSDQLTRTIDYLGAEVEAEGKTISLGPDGDAHLSYDLGESAAQVTIGIWDELGRLVATRQGVANAGSHSLSWDGVGNSGERLPEGLYRVEVAAQDETGEPIPVSTTISGVVDGVEIDGDRLMLSLGGVLLPLDAVTVVRRSTTTI